MTRGAKLLDSDVRVPSLLLARTVVVSGSESIHDDTDRTIARVELSSTDEPIAVVSLDEVVKDILRVDVVGVGPVSVASDLPLACGRVGDCDEGRSSMPPVHCVGGAVL